MKLTRRSPEIQYVIIASSWSKSLAYLLEWTHQGLVPHTYISKLGHHWFRWWLVACTKQLSDIVNWTLWKKKKKNIFYRKITEPTLTQIYGVNRSQRVYYLLLILAALDINGLTHTLTQYWFSFNSTVPWVKIPKFCTFHFLIRNIWNLILIMLVF